MLHIGGCRRRDRLPEGGSDRVAERLGYWWRESVSDLAVGGCLPAGDLPRIEVTLDYLFLDASFFRMHPGSPPELVLAAWGITTSGKPAFIGLAPAR
jgi:hypothetical protein